MDFISNQAPQIREMLSALGIERFEDLQLIVQQHPGDELQFLIDNI